MAEGLGLPDHDGRVEKAGLVHAGCLYNEGLMVDGHLPMLERDRRPLRSLFLDLNSYFASVEQQEHPELRGRPVGVGAVEAESGTIIAASYEAKAFGVRTGTKVGEARQRCPEIVLVHGNHKTYAAYHNAILKAVEDVLPVEKVRSVDEMSFRLIGEEAEPARAIELAKALKTIIRERVGECLRCSIGIAPNTFVAKLGTEMQKPDGLVLIEGHELPDRLACLQLTDFTGINRRMEIRLQAQGIFTGADLCRASQDLLHRAFGSVIGERWWYLLRGYELVEEPTQRRTLGHSHVLPPRLRTEEGTREVLLRLLHKAAARLRSEGLWAEGMAVSVRGIRQNWSFKTRMPPTQDTHTMQEHVLKAWPQRTFAAPIQVGVTFYDLKPSAEVTPSLFDSTVERADLSRAVDKLNHKFGKNSVFLAGMEHAKDTAQERIAFNKTQLFSEGKDDNVVE